MQRPSIEPHDTRALAGIQAQMQSDAVPPHCATCAAFIPVPGGTGECHAQPPALRGPAQALRTAWPTVAATDFCMAHAPAHGA